MSVDILYNITIHANIFINNTERKGVKNDRFRVQFIEINVELNLSLQNR